MSDERKSKPGVDAAKWAGVGVGIGSAALVAALLYANRDRLLEKRPKKAKPIEYED